MSSAGQDAPGSPRNKNSTWAYSGVAAGRGQGGAEVVADQRRPRRCRASRLRAAPLTWVKAAAGSLGSVASSRSVDLAADQVRAERGQRVETACQGLARHQQHVVGRRLRLGAGRCADLLEQRVGLGQVDHPVDPGLTRGSQACPPDRTVSPGPACRLAAVCWAIRTPLSAPTRVAERARKLLAVARGDAQHHSRAGGLGGPDWFVR